jgi:DNA-binding MarR family transcriptional regulator
MFEKLKRAVTATERTNLDALFQAVTQEWSQGRLSDEEGEELFALIEKSRRSIFPPRRRRQRKPLAATTLAHRRQLAACGPLPSHLAALFTTAELAVLAIITINRGFFDRTIAELADRAKVGHSTVQKALRQAERLGLLTIEERRVTGRKNLPNVIRVVSPEWLTWISRGGSKKLKPLDTEFIISCNSRGSHPHIPQWKRLISRSSPGPSAIRSPHRR